MPLFPHKKGHIGLQDYIICIIIVFFYLLFYIILLHIISDWKPAIIYMWWFLQDCANSPHF